MVVTLSDGIHTGRGECVPYPRYEETVPQVLAALHAQGGAYTLETVTPQGERSYTRIESIQQVVPYQDDLAPLIAAGANPATCSRATASSSVRARVSRTGSNVAAVS